MGKSLSCRLAPWRFAGICLAVLLLVSCGSSSSSPTFTSPTSFPANPARTISLGNIEATDVARKIGQYQGLADYLGENLEEFGIENGQVVIARDQDEMVRFLKDGTVDLYFDNPFLGLLVAERSSAVLFLRQWKRNLQGYHSVFIAKKDGPITSLDDLVGQSIALQVRRSGAGFLLPRATLLDKGYELIALEDRSSTVPPNKIGYIISTGERSSIDMVLREEVAAAAFGNLGFIDMPPDITAQLLVIDRSFDVPVNIVLARAGLDAEFQDKIRELMIGLEHIEEGKPILLAMRETARFDDVPQDFKDIAPRVTKLLASATDN